jgi:hypothetical protein
MAAYQAFLQPLGLLHKKIKVIKHLQSQNQGNQTFVVCYGCPHTKAMQAPAHRS